LALTWRVDLDGDTKGTLRHAAAARGIHLGAAVAWSPLIEDSEYAKLLTHQFSYITPESQMKWGLLQPTPDAWDWAHADSMVARAEAAGQRIKGHTLVWHTELPEWVGEWMSAHEMRQALRTHIQATVGRYAGRIYAWDVVNEALDEGGGLRDSVLLRVMGPGYIADAFRWAHEADPNALLLYNDYSIVWKNAKSDGVLAMMQTLLQQNVPVDGVGCDVRNPVAIVIVVADVARRVPRR
jgi:endo-1,4-beta-xylanase